MARCVSRRTSRSRHSYNPLAINTPDEAAEEISVILSTMVGGFVLLLLDRQRLCVGGMKVPDAPRNGYMEALDALTLAREELDVASVILGVLSPDAEALHDVGGVDGFGSPPEDLLDRLARDADTSRSWHNFGVALEQRGVQLLDVIEWGVSTWTSIQAPLSDYHDYHGY